VTTIAGRYRLEREIGRGGMGEVWLAEDVVLQRRVAAKRIGALPGTTDADLERVRREAQVSAMLNHEHVVVVFDLVEEAGQHWLVMEYVESENLAELVRRGGPISPDAAARLIAQAAAALAAAHQAGIVHRDVKPSNILVTPEGQVKLGDFGIARLEADQQLTRTGLLVGSPGFLAPEVAGGSPASPASDMWSLGATIFHAVEGHSPYETVDGNVIGTLYRIVNEPVPQPEHAGWLTPLIGQLMRHDPSSRWDSTRAAAYLAGGPDGGLATADHGAGRGPARPAAGACRACGRAHQRDPGRAAGRARAIPTPTGAPRGPDRDRPGRRDRAAVRRVPGPRHEQRRWTGGRSGHGHQHGGSTGTSPGDGASASTSPASSEATDAGITSFIESYLATAPKDPQAAFAQLTPEFQDQSGGLDGYSGFWDTIATATPSNIEPDADRLTVSYDVAYVRDDGGHSNDSVSLDLDFQDGKYLIAGES
jgi:serine/threonine protein kinase